MTYTSTITSKGTITLPSMLRAQLGLKEGDKVEISLQGNAIIARPQIGWDEFFSDDYDMGKKARDQIKNGQKKSLLTNSSISQVVREARRGRHA